MSAEIPICPLCHTPRMPRRRGFGVPGLSNVNSTHHDDPSGATESQDAATEAANPSSQRQDPSEGMSPPPSQALGKWHGKGKYVSAVGSHHQRQRATGTSKSIQRKLVTDERKLHSNRLLEGRTELDMKQDEIDEAKRLLEEAHLEVQANQSTVTEAAFQVGEATEEMSQIKKLLEANLEPANQ